MLKIEVGGLWNWYSVFEMPSVPNLFLSILRNALFQALNPGQIKKAD